MYAKIRATTALVVALSVASVSFAQTAEQLPSATLPSASATQPVAPPPQPKQTMPLAPKLPAIEQLQRALFPSTVPQTKAENEPEMAAGERLVRALLADVVEFHFALTDYTKREEFRKKWEEKAKGVKTLEEADKLNREMLQSLGQRFDYYNLPEAVDQAQKRATSSAVGIGVSVELKGLDEIVDGLSEDITEEQFEKMTTVTAERQFVLNPFKGGPADKAGVKTGDVLLKVDGKEILGKTRKEVIDLIRGKQGSKVELTVERKNKDGKVEPTKPFSVVREAYIAPVVHTRLLPDNVFYIKLDNFVADNAAEEMLAALKEAAKLKDGKIVLDLRDNGGGRLDHAINIVSYMLSEGTIVTLRRREGNQLVNVHYSATPDALLTTKPAGFNPNAIQYSAAARVLAVPPTMPIIILVNEWSASASELTSGALQFHKRAKIVGVNTIGKGVGQVVRMLPEKRDVHVTTFYFDPADRVMDFEGIHPDKEVSLEPEVKKLVDLRKELRETLAKVADPKKRLESAGGEEKAPIQLELSTLEAKEKDLRGKLKELHTMLREDDPQLHAARLLAGEEFQRIQKEEAAKKKLREESTKKKQEEWEKERQKREENLKKGASAAAKSAA